MSSAGSASPSPRHMDKTLCEVDAAQHIAVSRWLRKHGKTVKVIVTEEQQSEFQQCFRLMDDDGSGAIDVQELHGAFKLLGVKMTNKEMKTLVEEVDRDHTGDVGWSEFLEIMTETMKKLADEPQTGEKSYQMPFGLMATQYRRRRYMDSILAGTKEGFNNMVRMAEQNQQQEVHKTSSLGLGHPGAAGSDPRLPHSPRRASSGAPASPRSPRPARSQQALHAEAAAATPRQMALLRAESQRDRERQRPMTSPSTSQRRSSTTAVLPARRTALYQQYNSWMDVGQDRPGTAGSGLSASGSVGNATQHQLLQMPQANLNLCFTRSIIKMPQASSAACCSVYSAPSSPHHPSPRAPAPSPDAHRPWSSPHLGEASPPRRSTHTTPQSKPRDQVAGMAFCLSSSPLAAHPPSMISPRTSLTHITPGPAPSKQHAEGALTSSLLISTPRSGQAAAGKEASIRERSWAYASNLGRGGAPRGRSSSMQSSGSSRSSKGEVRLDAEPQ